ncbi:MAG: hypothetical protein HW386_2237 [Gammaproteobacteria bacterium]|nr:hypothetical protein [Gammaproteobacteria bacterium]
MRMTVSERALARVLTYLNGMDVPMNNATHIAALKLVEEALTREEVDLYVYIMDRIPERFSLPELQLPPRTPPLHRGSIGYGKS